MKQNENKIYFNLKTKNIKYETQQTTSCSESTTKTLPQDTNKLSRTSQQ